MKRSLILMLALAIVTPIGLIGCSEKSETETTTKTTTPTGSVEKTDKETVKKTGDEKTDAPK